MDRVETNKKAACPSSDLSAYIDGELSPHDELELEMHIAGCRVCTDNLNLQKGFLNALDSSLDDEIEIQLPKNFTKTVVANAESRVTGLRHPHELRQAALICVALILVSILIHGGNTERTLLAASTVVEKLFAILVTTRQVIYDLGLGSSIVLRSLATNFLFESGSPALAFVVLFVLSLYVFSRLLRFRRT
jgi:anti-sigma factor RsiW